MANPMRDLMAIRSAVTAYQQLTQDKSYGSRVEQGKVQLVRVTYNPDSTSNVEPCSEWLAIPDFLKHMKDISL